MRNCHSAVPKHPVDSFRVKLIIAAAAAAAAGLKAQGLVCDAIEMERSYLK